MCARLKIYRPLTISAIVCAGFLAGMGSALSQALAVPNALRAVEGNSGSNLPFILGGPNTMRYQQVYDASQFSLAAGGGWIYMLTFRLDSEKNKSGFSAVVTNVEIRLSITQKQPDGLSSVFSENIGCNETVVLSNSLAMASGFAPFGQPQAWWIRVPLSTLYWYDPAAGNLLMDVWLREGVDDRTVPVVLFDAQDTPGDSVSRVWAFSVEDAISGFADSVGLVTLFTIAPVPSLRAYLSDLGTSTNHIVLRWPTQPNNYILQRTASLSESAWESLPCLGGSNLVFQEYRIPVASSGTIGFYRLALDPIPKSP
jgi:hypothetical protein